MSYSFYHFWKGWTVVNVEYRMANTALAPAAVEDTRCALAVGISECSTMEVRYNQDCADGPLAGGHLALDNRDAAGWYRSHNQCYGTEKLNVAAIINWFGITDVNDIIKGPNLKNYGAMWMGSQPNADEIARRVSPLTYVRAGLPPILTIHGDKDDVVPYSHATRLHEALDKVKVPNQLFTIKGGGHGGFTQDEFVKSYDTIWSFLRQNKIIN